MSIYGQAPPNSSEWPENKGDDNCTDYRTPWTRVEGLAIKDKVEALEARVKALENPARRSEPPNKTGDRPRQARVRPVLR